DVERRKVSLDVAEIVLVPLQRQRRVHPPLQQNLVAANVQRLLNLLEQRRLVENVRLTVLQRPVERTKIANGRTDICVVDVAVDVVRANRRRMQPLRDGMGRSAESGEVVTLEKLDALGRRKTLAGNGFVEDRLD